MNIAYEIYKFHKRIQFRERKNLNQTQNASVNNPEKSNYNLFYDTRPANWFIVDRGTWKERFHEMDTMHNNYQYTYHNVYNITIYYAKTSDGSHIGPKEYNISKW